MKLKIKKEVLLDGLNKVSKAISTKNLIPILSGVKFDLTKKGLTLLASDNDITIQVFIPSEDNMDIEMEGSIIIQGKYVLDIVRKLPDEYINIEVVDELKIVIYTENSEFNLNGIDKSEYPTISLEESKSPVYLKTNIFKDIVNQTSFAASNDESRPVLTGINFKIGGNLLECNVTDSYRLARKVIELESPVEDSYNIIIPSKNLIEFNRIINETEEAIEMHIFNNKILFKYGNLLFQSRLISGTYPNTSNLLPEDSLLTITTSVIDLYNVIDRASILTSDKEKNVVTLETKDNLLTLQSSSLELGRADEKMQVEKNNDENIRISFVAKYMMEALKSFSSEKVDISFVGEIKPIILKSQEDPTLVQLVLPIRTY